MMREFSDGFQSHEEQEAFVKDSLSVAKTHLQIDASDIFDNLEIGNEKVNTF